MGRASQLVRQSAAPHVVRWVRRFLSRQASDEPLADQVRRFCDDLERHGGVEDWQVRQAEQALRIYAGRRPRPPLLARLPEPCLVLVATSEQ